jgi:hypothetical protein
MSTLNVTRESDSTQKGSKAIKSLKRMSNDEIFTYICSGIKVPKHYNYDELMLLGGDMLCGTDEYIGLGRIQNAIGVLLKINLIKMGVNAEDADDFVDDLNEGWEGTIIAADLCYCILDKVFSKQTKLEEKARKVA